MPKGKLTAIISTRPQTLGKVFSLTANGLQKETAGEMVSGSFTVAEFATVSNLTAILSNIGTDQAIMASLPVTGATSGEIVTKAMLPDHPGAVSRTKDHFHFPANQPGLVVLDYDPPLHGVPLSRDQLWGLLKSVVPAVAESGVVWWSSGSSYIFHGEDQIQGLRGQRLYLMVSDVSDTERFGEMLAKRLWLAGHGRIEVSASGQRLVRSTFDTAMFQAARLDFIGGAVCKPPLEQRRGSPVVLSNGGWLDTVAALPSLSAKEEAAYEAKVDDEKEQAEPLARVAGESWKASRMNDAAQRLMRSGTDLMKAREQAERSLSSALGGTLLGDFLVTLADGTEITVGAILDNKEKYHGTLTRDPLEPEYRNGAQTGKLFLFGAHPILHSQAHGGKTFRLRRQPARICLSSGRRAEVAEEIAHRLVAEPDVFFRGGVPVRYDGGRLVPLRRAPSVCHLVGTRYAVCRINAKGEEVPADLDEGTANIVLSLLGGV